MAWHFEDGTEFLVLNMLEESGVFLEKLGLLLSSEIYEFRKMINSKRKSKSLTRGLNECIVSMQNDRKICVLINYISNYDIEEFSELELIDRQIDEIFKYLNLKKIFANIYMQ